MISEKSRDKTEKKMYALEIYEKIASYQYISFDIFDTLIKRNVKNPTDIFKIIELAEGNNFAEKRIEAEKKARTLSKREEVTIQEIYECFPGENKKYLMQLELDIELEAIVPNKSLIELYTKCIDEGKTVFITSDMYWPEKDIRLLLEKNGIQGYKALYLSSKELKTKRTGSLFKVLLQKEKISVDQLIHIGDNWKSDYIVPKKIGIDVVKIPTYVERIKYRKKENTGKLENSYLDTFINNTYMEQQDYYYQFGYAQFGKLLWGYCRWLYEQAVEKGINRLFFFARDGLIMKKAFDMCSFDKNIQTCYLEISRRSLRCPILWLDCSYETMLDLVVNAKQISIRSIFDGLGLSLDKYKNRLLNYDLSTDSIFDRNSIRKNPQLKALLQELRTDIFLNSKQEYKILEQYLRQEGVNGKIGVVDIGYAGSMQRYLQQAMNQMNISNEIIGFYFGVADYYKKNELQENDLDLNGYLFDFKHNPHDIDTRSAFVGLFETLFLEQAGSVKRYIKGTNMIEVERYPYEYFEDGKPTNDLKKVRKIQEGALDFVEQVRKDAILNKFRFTAEDLFEGIYLTGCIPKKKDLMMFGNLKFYDEGITECLANPKSIVCYLLHPRQLKSDFLTCRWKVGFMKKLFKIPLPYLQIYKKLQKIDRR